MSASPSAAPSAPALSQDQLKQRADYSHNLMRALGEGGRVIAHVLQNKTA